MAMGSSGGPTGDGVGCRRGGKAGCFSRSSEELRVGFVPGLLEEASAVREDVHLSSCQCWQLEKFGFWLWVVHMS